MQQPLPLDNLFIRLHMRLGQEGRQLGVGAHWLSDVVFGTGLAWVIALRLTEVLGRWEEGVVMMSQRSARHDSSFPPGTPRGGSRSRRRMEKAATGMN